MIKIELEEDEYQFLMTFVNKGQKNARELTRARILLLANKNKNDKEIVEILNIGRNTVGRIKKSLLKRVLKVLLKINQERANQKSTLKNMRQKS